MRFDFVAVVFLARELDFFRVVPAVFFFPALLRVLFFFEPFFFELFRVAFLAAFFFEVFFLADFFLAAFFAALRPAFFLVAFFFEAFFFVTAFFLAAFFFAFFFGDFLAAFFAGRREDFFEAFFAFFRAAIFRSSFGRWEAAERSGSVLLRECLQRSEILFELGTKRDDVTTIDPDGVRDLEDLVVFDRGDVFVCSGYRVETSEESNPLGTFGHVPKGARHEMVIARAVGLRGLDRRFGQERGPLRIDSGETLEAPGDGLAFDALGLQVRARDSGQEIAEGGDEAGFFGWEGFELGTDLREAGRLTAAVGCGSTQPKKTK